MSDADADNQVCWCSSREDAQEDATESGQHSGETRQWQVDCFYFLTFRRWYATVHNIGLK